MNQMAFGDILKKIGLGKTEEGSKEVELEHPDAGANPLSIRIDNLTGMVDVDRVARMVKDGNVMFLKLRELQRRDIGEFQNTLQKLKRTCSQFGWDMVALEDGYLIVTPKFAKVERA